MTVFALSTADLVGSLVLLAIGASLVIAYGLIPDHADGYAYERWSRRPGPEVPAPAPLAGPRSAVEIRPARPYDWRLDDPDLGDPVTPGRLVELFDVPPEMVGLATRGDGSPLRRPAT